MALADLTVGHRDLAVGHEVAARKERTIGSRAGVLAFEQQPKESDKAFAAFNQYLSQGAERSLAKTAAKLGRSKVMMEKWSKRFDWLARVAAYNAHMALVEREAAEVMLREKGVDWAKLQERVRQEAWREGE